MKPSIESILNDIRALLVDSKGNVRTPTQIEYFERDLGLINNLKKRLDSINYINEFHRNMRNFSQSFGSYCSRPELLDAKWDDLNEAIVTHILEDRDNGMKI